MCVCDIYLISFVDFNKSLGYDLYYSFYNTYLAYSKCPLSVHLLNKRLHKWINIHILTWNREICKGQKSQDGDMISSYIVSQPLIFSSCMTDTASLYPLSVRVYCFLWSTSERKLVIT